MKFLLGNSLLGPITIAACVLNFVAQGIVLGVQGIAFFRYDANAHVLGFLFAGFGVGALAGAVVAQQATQKVPLQKLAAVAIVALPLPLFLLSPTTPWPVATIIIGAFAFFVPLVNAPIAGLVLVRTPAGASAEGGHRLHDHRDHGRPARLPRCRLPPAERRARLVLPRPPGLADDRQPRVRGRAATAARTLNRPTSRWSPSGAVLAR